MNNKVTGVVTKVGDKFNGSVQLDGTTYYSNKKGFVNPAKLGDKVELTLSDWSFNGKAGKNITGCVVLSSEPVKAPEKALPVLEKAKSVTNGQRDFDKEARGKVRHGLIVSLLPLVATQTITLDKAKETVNDVLPFVMGE